MEHSYALSILYDMALVIGGEVSVKPLLTRLLQRLLYHTSFPAGFVCLTVPPASDADLLDVHLDAAVGDYELAGLVGQTVRLPARLVRGAVEQGEDDALPALLPAKVGRYQAYLRLPIDGQGVIVLLAPHLPDTELPLTQLFQPVMANLAKAILLCSYHDAYTGELIAAREASQEALAASEEKFRAISAAALDALIMVDDSSKLVYWNPAAERILGYRTDEVLGKPLHQLLTPQRYRAQAIQGFDAFRLSGQGPVIGKTIEIEALHKGGHEIPVELSLSAFNLKGHWYAVGILRDITERKQAKLGLEKSNRALHALSACNGALVRASNEPQLLNDVCHILVNVGGYQLAWVGFAADDVGKSVRPVARAGSRVDYLDRIGISWDDIPEGQGPTGTAIRTGQYQVAQDILHDPKFLPWREQATVRGYAASIALPIFDENGRAFGAINLYGREPDAFDPDEIRLLQELAADLGYGIRTLRLRAERDLLHEQQEHHDETVKRALAGTIQAMAATVEKRDPYTAGHQRRVAELSVAIAMELGLDPERITGLRLGAIIHDIGKIYVPAEILTRPGQLTPMEYDFIKMHPQVGYDIMKDVELPWPVAEMILQHHERLDGSGYPHGLRGEAILLEARILSVADVADAMMSHRPYRPSLGLETALAEINKYRGSHFDPAVVDACLHLFRDRGYTLEG